MPFFDKVISHTNIQTDANYLCPKSEEILIMKGIANSIKLLLSFAIEGTKAFTMLEKMHYFCLKELCLYENENDTEINNVASLGTLRYLSLVFKYVSSGNIPIAFSAVAPCFLLKKKYDNESENIKNEIKNFLDLIAEDQTLETKKNMENIILDSTRIYLSIK
ncbi:MAG: hypothetical protein IRD7MM_03260 [Candidatus Midichloria mitochondrii]|nr:hypothetical protein [Candidatus Midichloria mitochondrii]MDJ1288244.1 hypothetical protein [Candidatus Midichloria mitochondrii]MDJ1299112.1 hypothetical protein [Candidatus Midichloria mitochondrii]MDJ1312804.1 hypothetical protein [Candidatus Midichloria mitochondrii]MDJ1583549.1 hypothetical protein [Candidatus Midichloria mitochondrii]